MAKLFQTRLKIEEQAATLQPFNPQINQGSTTPYISDIKINQGSTTPYISDVKINQGSTTPYASDTKINQGSILISKIQLLPDQGRIQLSIPVDTSPGLLTIPREPNTIFSNKINLEDRIRQSPLVGTTTGLQQFFLSDFYAGRLANPNYSFIPNQGGIILQAYGFIPNQGSTTLTITGFNPNQGTINVSPFNFQPIQGSITLVNYNFLPNQGTQTLNNNTTSISTILPFDFLPSQGSITLSQYNFLPFQDPSTIVVQPLSTNQIQLLQGLTLDNAGNLVSFVIPNIVVFNPNQGSIVLNEFNFTPDQGAITISTPNFIPTQGSTTPNIIASFNSLLQAISNPTQTQGEANLNILGYELDRLLAKTLPEVKHGSSEKFDFSDRAVNQGIGPFSTKNPPPDTGNTYSRDSTYGAVINTPDTALTPTPDGIVVKDEVFFELSDVGINNYIQVANQRMGQPPLISSPRSNKVNLLNVDFDYGTLNDFENIKQNSPYLSGVGKGNQPQIRSNADYPIDNIPDFGQDYVNLNFTSIRDNNTLQFKAYITNLSDNWSPTFTDVKYVGRQDTLKVFNGTTRNISLAFKIPSHNKQSHANMYDRIQQLIRSSAVGKYKSGTPYVIGPSLKATIGNYIVGTPCIATSLKIDTNPSEYPWEIDSGKQLPQFLDVSMELFILGDNDGKTINSSGTFVSIK